MDEMLVVFKNSPQKQSDGRWSKLVLLQFIFLVVFVFGAISPILGGTTHQHYHQWHTTHASLFFLGPHPPLIQKRTPKSSPKGGACA